MPWGKNTDTTLEKSWESRHFFLHISPLEDQTQTTFKNTYSTTTPHLTLFTHGTNIKSKYTLSFAILHWKTWAKWGQNSKMIIKEPGIWKMMIKIWNAS